MSLITHLVEPATVEELRALLADLESQQRREKYAFRDGYRAGFESGWDIGYGFRCHEEHLLWAGLARKVKATASHPIRSRLGAE